MSHIRKQRPEWRTPYVSVACRMGAHSRCTEAEPRPMQHSSSVIYETCSCSWCHPRQEGVLMYPNRASVSVNSATVLRGDVIQVGGQSLVVSDIVTLPHRAKCLRFETGESLTMHGRTQLAAFRRKGRW